MNHSPRILATRVSKTQTDSLEALCLEWGIDKRFRLYTSTDEDLSESVWDLDPVEFTDVEETDLVTYLVESLRRYGRPAGSTPTVSLKLPPPLSTSPPSRCLVLSECY